MSQVVLLFYLNVIRLSASTGLLKKFLQTNQPPNIKLNDMKEKLIVSVIKQVSQIIKLFLNDILIVTCFFKGNAVNCFVLKQNRNIYKHLEGYITHIFYDF